MRLDALDTARITRVAGRTGARTAVVTRRPCRAPRHTIAAVGRIGGGQVPLPGEGSLAHQGILFLDEMPERRHILEVLRQALQKNGLGNQSPARRGPRGIRGLRHTGDGREGFGQRTVAAHHAPDRWSRSRVTVFLLNPSVWRRPILFA
jgi:hypothetical protein